MKLRHDVYEDFYKDKGLFELSNYPKDSKFYDPVNEKAIGKTKEVGEINDEFVGLKSKMYSLVLVDNEENKKQKESIVLFLKT